MDGPVTATVTIKDIAREAGVSNVTVSRVLNTPDLVRQETRDRVEEAVRRLGYTPNLAARAMRTRATRTIGFVVPNILSRSNAAVAQAAEQTLARHGYGMMLVSSGFDVASGLRALEMLRIHRVDGTLVYLADQSEPRLVEALRALDGPCVILDRTLPLEADTVFSDHAKALTEAIAYLVSLGHEAIAFVAPDLDIRPILESRRAFGEAARDAGLDATRQSYVAVRPDDIATFRADDLLTGPARPTAIFVNDSRLLRAVVDAVRRLRLSVPDDISIIGIGMEEIGPLMTPELTTIVRDFGEIGRTAAAFLLERLQSADAPWRTVTLESHVLLKGSCAPAKRRAT